MVAELTRERLGIGDERDVAAGVQASRRHLHAERPAADHNHRRARGDQLPEHDRILNGAQGELPRRAGVSRPAGRVLGCEPFRPRPGGDDKAVVRQPAAVVEPDNLGVNVQSRRTDAEQLGRFVRRLGQFVGRESATVQQRLRQRGAAVRAVALGADYRQFAVESGGAQ